MDFVVGLAAGLLIGAVAIVFVYRNNKAKFDAAAEKAEAALAQIKKGK